MGSLRHLYVRLLEELEAVVEMHARLAYAQLRWLQSIFDLRRANAESRQMKKRSRNRVRNELVPTAARYSR